MAGKLKEDVMEFETSGEVDVTPTFDSLGLREDLLRGIYAYGLRLSGMSYVLIMRQDSRSHLRFSSARSSPL
jgi:hypothetical protein